MTIRIRRATVSDWEPIRHFIFEAYGKSARFKDYPRWNWQFVANPFRPSLSDEVSVWIAEDEGQVVGQIAVQPTVVQIDSSEYPGGWIVDVMILPAYRGRLLGHQLHAAVAGNFPLLITLTMAPATRRIAQRAGSVTLGCVHQYIKIINLSDATVRRYLLARAARRPSFLRLLRIVFTLFRFDWLVSRLLNASRDINLKRFFRGQNLTAAERTALEIVEVEQFDDEVDYFWAQVRHDYDAISVRDARFLNWRFVNAPDLDYRRFIARRAGRCVGYIVIRSSSVFELPAGLIVDFLTFKSDLEAARSLMEHVAKVFGSEVEFIDCATSVMAFGALLENLGFLRTRTEHPTVVCRDPLLRRRIQALKENWFFTKGDHDWDQVLIRDGDERASSRHNWAI